MVISVHKCHAQGNDFLLIDSTDFERLSPEQVITLCHRQKGLGCDQLVVLDPSDSSDHMTRSRLFNQDGSAAGLCLNAAYALSQYVQKTLGQKPWTLYQGARKICHTIPDMPHSMQLVLADFNPRSHIRQLEHHGKRLLGYYYHLGNEHWIIPCQNIHDAPLLEVGQYCQEHPNFPDGVNVSFYETNSNHQVSIRTYERGVGPTLSCGSATLAVWLQIQQSQSWATDSLRIHQPGGSILLKSSDSHTLTWQGQYRYIAQANWHEDCL